MDDNVSYGPSYVPSFRKKEFVPAQEPNEAEEVPVEQKLQEDRRRLGQEAHDIYKAIISTPSTAHKFAKKNAIRSSSQTHEETYYCEVCKDQVPISVDLQEHLRTVPHLVSEDYKVSKKYYISEANVGYQMLKQMNWEEDQGLGKEGQGRLDPIQTQLKVDKKGLGKVTLPWKVTHYKPGEVPKDHRKKRIQTEPRTRKTKPQKQAEEQAEKRREQAIRNEVYSRITWPY